MHTVRIERVDRATGKVKELITIEELQGIISRHEPVEIIDELALGVAYNDRPWATSGFLYRAESL